MTTIDGRCHCGSIHWQFTSTQPAADLPVRHRTCSSGTKHGAPYSPDPDGRLSVEIRHPEDLGACRFAIRSAEPRVCRRYGVLPLTFARIEGRLYAVVDLATADGFGFPAGRADSGPATTAA